MFKVLIEVTTKDLSWINHQKRTYFWKIGQTIKTFNNSSQLEKYQIKEQEKRPGNIIDFSGKKDRKETAALTAN